MNISEHSILALGQAIRTAADHEDWATLARILARFQTQTHTQQFTQKDKETLSKTLLLLDEAINSVTRRKEEIRDLVNKIGNSPL